MTVMFFFSFGKDRDAQDGYFTSSRVYCVVRMELFILSEDLSIMFAYIVTHSNYHTPPFVS
jgi:hypothetical protein